MPKGTLWYRREGSLVESASLGHMDESSATVLIRALEDAHRETGWCAAFHDWEQATGYTTRMRMDWIRWSATPAARAARFTHFRLGRSHLLRMAVSVASVAFAPQQFVVHETGEAYAAARAAHLSPPTPIPELGTIRR